MSMAHEWRPCTWQVNAELEAWMHLQPAVQLLFVSQLAQQLAKQLDCERGCCQAPVFEASVPLCSMPGAILEKDLLQVASTEETDSNDAAEGPLLMTDSEDDSEDHLQVASTEEESEKDTRRLSLGTTATGVPEEDDVLQELDESDEGEDINNVDDHSDGDGVAQASAQQGLLNAESEDDLEAPEVLKTESEDNLEESEGGHENFAGSDAGW